MSTVQADHEWFMRLAMAEAAMCAAAGGRAYGSIVVRDGIVIGRSGARKDSYKNPTGHAEILAIQEAASYLGTADMTGCTLYNNQGSCFMCCALMLANNISFVVTGIRPEQGQDNLDKLVTLMDRGQYTNVIRGVLYEETARHFQALVEEGQSRQPAR